MIYKNIVNIDCYTVYRLFLLFIFTFIDLNSQYGLSFVHLQLIYY